MALDRKTEMARIQRERRLEASRKKSFQPLMTSPTDVSSVGLTLPESGNIGVSYSVPISQGQLLLNSSNGRSVGTPDLAANQVWRIGFYEKGVVLNPAQTPAGTLTIHYLDDRRVPHVIATGDF